jgi:hypothetical protein
MATRWRFGMNYAHQLTPQRPNQSLERTATRLASTRRVARVLLMSSACALGRRPFTFFSLGLCWAHRKSA